MQMRCLLIAAVWCGLALCRAQAAEPTAERGADPRCQALQAAALANALPLEFLTRLIWQESRFNDFEVSRAGAQGIAQFMPATAVEVKLANPFEPISAIGKSAELLRALLGKFGNLGLAAAAYNAGPRRVTDWLSGRHPLPQETVHYVRIITGHAPDEWRSPQSSTSMLNLPLGIPCPEIVRLISAGQSFARQQPAKPAEPAAAARPVWGVQLTGDSSEPAALAAFYKMQRSYPSVLGSHEPLVLRSAAGRNAYWYRVRIGANSRNDAEHLCSSLRAVGGSCLVQIN